jgi:hypothetical protein
MVGWRDVCDGKIDRTKDEYSGTGCTEGRMAQARLVLSSIGSPWGKSVFDLSIAPVLTDGRLCLPLGGRRFRCTRQYGLICMRYRRKGHTRETFGTRRWDVFAHTIGTTSHDSCLPQFVVPAPNDDRSRHEADNIGQQIDDAKFDMLNSTEFGRRVRYPFPLVQVADAGQRLTAVLDAGQNCHGALQSPGWHEEVQAIQNTGAATL